MESLDELNIGVPAATQEDISARLIALNRWQEEQKRLLEERQNNRRLMLGLEQRNVYQMLGLLHKEISTINEKSSEDVASGNDIIEPEGYESIERPRHADNQQDNMKQGLEQLKVNKIPNDESSSSTARNKRPFLRRGEGLKQRFKIDPDKLRLNNLPHYKFANAHPQYQKPTLSKQKRRNILKTKNDNKPVDAEPEQPPTPLSLKEQRFQQLLINAKHTANSTPDLKSSYASSSKTSSSISPKVRFVEVNESEPGRGQTADDEQSSSEANSGVLTEMCWAKVLDTQQIKPPVLHRRAAQIRVEDEENVSIFELLEQKAREGNIDMNSSCIRTFMARKEQLRRVESETDQIVIMQQMRQMRLQPEVSEVINEHEDDEDDENSTLTATPLKIEDGKAQVRVRFSDSTDTHEYSDGTTLQDGSNVQLFEEFKSALFQALEQKKMQQTNQVPNEDPLTQDLHIKADLVRTRLQELETEIATFKEQNAQLLRLKKEHELNKAQCAQEHQEAMERVHDEKIQAEIYLHDERMKIEEARRKFEQQMRFHKSNLGTKEKKEIAALKKDLEVLQLQLKQKEQTHVSAQARLRAQLRASDREQQKLRDEIDLLSRENKRMEQEMLKITRENNNKLLHDINRNIARLAPKVETISRATLNTDENEKRQNKSISDVLQETASKQRVSNRRHSCGRTRKKLEAINVSFSSCSSDDDEPVSAWDTIPPPLPAMDKGKGTKNKDGSENVKREIVNDDGSKDIWYPNGNLKKISSDGMSVRMLYYNKDIKETDIRAGTVKYYYEETNTWHTSYLDGLEILEFPNGQVEHRHKNGVVEIHFPNNAVKIVDPNDKEKLEEWRMADGRSVILLRNGDKILNLANGQKEIHTKLNKRREYPDGTVKLVYPDGSQESRYSNGRVRLKDKDGKLLMDTDYAKY